MEWLCQLGDGYMLGINGVSIEKVFTGYPYPDVDGGQVDKISKFLGVPDIDLKSCIEILSKLNFPMSGAKVKKELMKYERNIVRDYSLTLGREKVLDDLGKALRG